MHNKHSCKPNETSAHDGDDKRSGFEFFKLATMEYVKENGMNS